MGQLMCCDNKSKKEKDDSQFIQISKKKNNGRYNNFTYL